MQKDKILVIGDSIVDVNVLGKVDRISPEAPVQVVNIFDETYSLGGAANVASHVANAEIPVILAYKEGNCARKEDELSYRVFESLCNDKNIELEPLNFNKNCPMTTKKRIWANGKQQICRIDYENSDPPDIDTMYKWVKQLIEITEKNNIKVVLISDYNKGSVTDDLIKHFTQFCKHVGIKTILDPKRPSFYKLKDLDIIKPNKREVASTNLTAEECSTYCPNTYFVNTLAEQGIKVYKDGTEILSIPTYTKAEEVVDVTGAGDTINSMLGIALYKDLNKKQAVVAANKAASYAIRNMGTYALNKDEIDSCLFYGDLNG